jgi:hypothetical protein
MSSLTGGSSSGVDDGATDVDGGAGGGTEPVAGATEESTADADAGWEVAGGDVPTVDVVSAAGLEPVGDVAFSITDDVPPPQPAATKQIATPIARTRTKRSSHVR